MTIREQLLNKDLIAREQQGYNYYILKELGQEEAERLIGDNHRSSDSKQEREARD
jgi:hypothetical protein